MTKKTWITALTFGVPWTIVMLVYNSMSKGGFTLGILVSNLIGGLVAGVLYALIMHYAAKRLVNKVVVETAAGEQVIKEGGANHFKGREGVGGKLVLTNRRLIFKSHQLNMQNHQQTFDLDQVEGVRTTKSLKILENGLTLELADKVSHKFIVDEPGDWVDEIGKQKNLIKQA